MPLRLTRHQILGLPIRRTGRLIRRSDTTSIVGSEARTVVYRNAQFKGTRELYRVGQFDMGCEYIAIEQSNGEMVFIQRHSLMKFCRPGAQLTGEQI